MGLNGQVVSTAAGVAQSTPGPTYTYSFDSMYRLAGMTDQNNNTDVSNVAYNAANRLTGISYFGGGETRTYNSLGQLTQIFANNVIYYNYNYPTGTNNGKISSTHEGLSGETISYTYDTLNRLATAAGSGWSQTYSYDGFGNLTAKTPGLSQAVNPATNQASPSDANGNQLTAPGFYGNITYDAENRMVAAPGVQYAYDSQNKRVWAATVNSSNGLTGQTVNFYGVNGQKIGTYTFYVNYGAGQYLEYSDSPANLEVFFGGKRVATIQNGTTTSYWQDRLGSYRGAGSSYYPWGEDRAAPAYDQVRFATYTRDSATLLDYADQRYYGNAQGRFMTPDPAGPGAANPQDPVSWNRYAYTRGDPVNRFDPSGTGDADLSTCAALFADASQPYDPYSSCSGPGGYSCPALDAMMAFQDNPDAATFYAQAAAIGCASAAATEVAQSAPQPSVLGPKCWQNVGNISATLGNLGSDIEQDVSKQFGSADLALLTTDINSDISSELSSLTLGALASKAPGSPNYIGGHFNLNLTILQIDQFSASDQQAFASDFAGASSDGVRQAASTGLAAQLGYSLHSQLNKIPGDYSFHFDRFNLQDLIGIAGHLGGDVFRGHLGHPCLDPAWRR